MLSTTNLSIHFEAKPSFEQVSAEFADGNWYGLIGANGIGKAIDEYLESQRIEV